MKRRILISTIIFIIILITTPFAMTFLEIEGRGIFTIVAIVTLVYVGIYIFGGLPELIVYGIYGIITGSLLGFLGNNYQVPIIVISTLLFLLNPLSQFQSWLRKQMDEGDTEPIQISIRGNRWPFFAYRKEMKNYYHLPQSRKLFINKSYKYLRQLSMLALIAAGIYLFIHEINHIANTLENFSWTNFLTFYVIVIIFLLAYFIHTKGFTSTFRTFAISLIPPILYIVSITNFDFFIKLFVNLGFLVFALVISGIELYRLHQRVIYDALYYYDVDLQKDVYANALFEPLVYNETYTLCTEYKIKINKRDFDKEFHRILVYANFFHFIIVAYTYGNEELTIYAHFYYKSQKRVEQFKTYLETVFQRSVELTAFSDFNKTSYEQKFFHKDAYIIARAQHLAQLLKDLHINSKIVISLVVYFENKHDFDMFNQVHPSVQLNDIAVEDYVSAKVDIVSINNSYIIESNLREVLLNLMVYHGKFVRLNVFY